LEGALKEESFNEDHHLEIQNYNRLAGLPENSNFGVSSVGF
jgi:hypothetical protein